MTRYLARAEPKGFSEPKHQLTHPSKKPPGRGRSGETHESQSEKVAPSNRSIKRRLRPEEFSGWAEVQRRGLDTFPFHPDFLNDPVLGRVFSKYGIYLLPLAFPEGSPMHSSYGSGHATKAGACVTMLKAIFDENQGHQKPGHGRSQ
jgi:hypothetical protein